MHSSLWLVILSTSVVLCVSFPFNGLQDIPELCLKLNNTFIEEFESLGVSLEEFFNSSQSEYNLNPKTPKAEEIFFNQTHLILKPESSEHYTFRFLMGVWNFTIQFDSSANISSIVPNGTLAELLPMDYHITRYAFPPKIYFYVPENTEEEIFHIIEGTRCKFSFNNDTGADGKEVCWNTPSICRGNFSKCIENDDIDHFCYDDISQEGTKPPTEDTEVHWTEIALSIYWKKLATYFIRENKTIEFHEASLKEWVCREYGGKGITFYCEPKWFYSPGSLYGSLALKTLSGFKG